MNKTIEQIYNRKSVRVFEDRPITPETKDLIFKAALQAPTAGNQTLYTILDIVDPDMKKALAVTCDNQPFIAKAPMVLIFLADCRRWYDCYQSAGAPCRKPGAGDLMLACLDAVIAAQNTVVAAESLGIGSCYIGDILEHMEAHEKMLHLDEYVLPIAMLVFGYPTEKQKKRSKSARFDQQYIVQTNTYSRLPEKELRNMFQARHPEPDFDFDSYITAFCKRKYMSDFSLEMTRSVSKYWKRFDTWE